MAKVIVFQTTRCTFLLLTVAFACRMTQHHVGGNILNLIAVALGDM